MRMLEAYRKRNRERIENVKDARKRGDAEGELIQSGRAETEHNGRQKTNAPQALCILVLQPTSCTEGL